MNKKQEYIFNRAIQSRLKGFKTWLEAQRNEQSTIRQKLNYTGYFLNWLECEGLTETGITYNDLLVFIDNCRAENKTKKALQHLGLTLEDYDKAISDKVIAAQVEKI